jgi:hypothetical protein
MIVVMNFGGHPNWVAPKTLLIFITDYCNSLLILVVIPPTPWDDHQNSLLERCTGCASLGSVMKRQEAGGMHSWKGAQAVHSWDDHQNSLPQSSGCGILVGAGV